ncbi:uncharacterized protein V1518DRAFT_423176 [Limtongia smithiae]|uniref:uncharacterized protein n=1 Tax=Limtongia smithiae TaxID=1125753 RepID=UPI0034CF62E6
MDLHVWAATSALPSLDADCLAALLFVHFAALTNITVVPSSNPFRFATALPVLTDSTTGVPVALGHVQVLRTLASKTTESALSFSARQTALASFAKNALLPVSLYVQRVHSQHYYSILRPAIFSIFATLPLPVRYMLPFLLIADAKYRISEIYDADAAPPTDPKAAATAATSAVPGFSFFQKRTPNPRHMVALTDAGIPTSVVNAVTSVGGDDYAGVACMLHVLSTTLPVLEAALEGSYLGGDAPSPADVVVMAQLYVQTREAYAVPFVADYIATSFPRIKAYLDRHSATLAELSMLPSRGARDDETISARSILLHYSGF